MILGRPTNLVLGAFTAVFNVIVLIASSQGYPITPEIIAGINIAAGAVILLVANQPPTVNEGDVVSVVTPAGQPNAKIKAKLP
jgi:hypothetical protein